MLQHDSDISGRPETIHFRQIETTIKKFSAYLHRISARRLVSTPDILELELESCTLVPVWSFDVKSYTAAHEIYFFWLRETKRIVSIFQHGVDERLPHSIFIWQSLGRRPRVCSLGSSSATSHFAAAGFTRLSIWLSEAAVFCLF